MRMTLLFIGIVLVLAYTVAFDTLHKYSNARFAAAERIELATGASKH
jgi:hypothetical protein